MCLILVAVDAHPHYRLVVAANRDEFFARPALPARYWDDEPELLAGRDLEQGGTWLGVTRRGRLAAITNVRSSPTVDNPRSRGHLVTDFLASKQAPDAFFAALAGAAGHYNGFNLLGLDFAAEQPTLYCYNNRDDSLAVERRGVFALSNDRLDAPWPKVERIKQAFARLSGFEGPALHDRLLDVLADARGVDDAALPETGVGLETERMLAPIFIRGAGYGTRASTVVTVDPNRQVRFSERYFDEKQRPGRDQRFEFVVDSAAAAAV